MEGLVADKKHRLMDCGFNWEVRKLFLSQHTVQRLQIKILWRKTDESFWLQAWGCLIKWLGIIGTYLNNQLFFFVYFHPLPWFSTSRLKSRKSLIKIFLDYDNLNCPSNTFVLLFLSFNSVTAFSLQKMIEIHKTIVCRRDYCDNITVTQSKNSKLPTAE